MIRVTFTDGELTELISVLTFFGIGMEQAGDRKQALCSKILVGKLSNNRDSARAANATEIRVTFIERELKEMISVLSVLGATMEAVDREMAACSFKLAGKLQNARRSAHEAKAAKRAANAGAESFAYRVLGVSLLAVVGGILFALIAGH